MKHDLETIIGWKLDEARSWLEQHSANIELHIVETAPPAKPPRRETAKRKNAPTVADTKSRERAGDWRVLRCRYLHSEKNPTASTCSAIEIVTAREILRNE